MEKSIYSYDSRQKRFLAAVESLKLEFPVAEISDKTKYGRPTVSKYLKEDGSASLSFIETFCEQFHFDFNKMKSGNPTPLPTPTVNAFPLGSIDDVVTEKTKSGNEFIDLGSGTYAMLVPVVHEYAYGGYLLGFRDPEYIDTLPKHAIIVNEKHRGIYRTFIQRGESMDNGEKDAIEPGDKVTGRLIPKQHWMKSKLHFRQYKEFVIHHKAGIITKEIIDHDVEKGTITVHARNPDRVAYPDEVIDLSEVEEIYNVVEVSKPRK